MPESTPGEESPKKIADVLTDKSGLLNTHDTVREAGDKMRSLEADTLAVSKGRKLVGMVTERHPDRSAAGRGHDPNVVRVAENMSRDLVFCYEDQSREEAERIMTERGMRYLPVVDREMRIVGMISQHDLNEAPSDSTAAKTMHPPGAPATSLERGETP